MDKKPSKHTCELGAERGLHRESILENVPTAG